MKRYFLLIVSMLLALPHLSYGFDSLPTAIPNGTTGQVLTSRGTSDTPYWAAATAGVTSQMGSFSLPCASSTTYTITGLSFQPSLVAFIAGDGGGNGASVGWDNGSNVAGTGYHDYVVIQPTHYAQTTNSFMWNNGATASCSGNITSWNSTSMTVTVTITGTPGAKTLNWVAFK